MPDEQQFRTGPRVLGDEVAGTMKRSAIYPSRGEAERVQLDAQHVGDSADTGEVHRPAVDVDDAL